MLTSIAQSRDRFCTEIQQNFVQNLNFANDNTSALIAFPVHHANYMLYKFLCIVVDFRPKVILHKRGYAEVVRRTPVFDYLKLFKMIIADRFFKTHSQR